MTTYIIYSDPTDGYLTSTNTNYATAQAGSNLLVNTAGDYIFTGLNSSGSTKYIYQGFYSFDTSVIADTEEIVDAVITAYQGYPQNQAAAWGNQFRNYTWASPLTTASWRTQPQLQALSLAANFDYLFSSTPFQWRSTGRDTLISSISKTAPTKFVSAHNWSIDGGAYTSGVLEMWTASGNTTQKPSLTVYTTALNTMNVVGHATTSLPDGTTIALRSDGAAVPALTVRYTPLGGSTTSLGTLNAAFNKDIDGVASLSVTSDPAGNFYILGTSASTGSSIVCQAWERTGTTTWVAKTPLVQAMPTGNEQAIRSTAVTYMEGGKDGNDKPCLYAMVSRGSGGNRPNFPYHLSGAGTTQEAVLNPVNLLAGSGTLMYGATNGLNGMTYTAIPSFVDMAKMGPNLTAVYVQRGRISGTPIGGLMTLSMYNTGATILGANKDYIETGASKLVAVSSTVFAHVFDNPASSKLSIRFYNNYCQLLGEASIPYASFWGGVAGSQWTAYYDKTANVVRVMYVSSASALRLDRFDVSPVTYSGTTATSVTTTFGAAGSTNTFLRAAPTTDERYVPIEGANISSGGVLSTLVYNSTVGNIVPSAPALTTRPNFDATSAATFAWKFGDSNPADYQTKYQLEISRVSDSVVVYDSGAVTSTVSSAVLPANTLSNAIAYRWRVRTYDVINSVGTWSGYGTFTTAATGTLTITYPATDNLAGLETDDYIVTWTYVQSGGATQAQRQVRVIRTADSAVIIDSVMQANTVNSYAISGLESGKEYRIEVSLINTSAIAVPVVSRLLTPLYSEPMTPELVVSQKDSYIELLVSNPTPTGDRPEVVHNDVYKRVSKANSTAADFKRVATISYNATYKDYAVKSGASYDYFVTGRTS